MLIPEKRIAEFEALGFGMFVHWGLYSQMGEGEWVQAHSNIPSVEYAKLMDSFTASKFDAKYWVGVAKAAGAKYITFTTRHHDGFSLYDTCGLNNFDSVHSPCGRDIVRELVDACNDEGIVPMLYHTTLDWRNQDFHENFPKYLQYLRDSVEILCTNYGKIGGFWFDGNWSKKDADWEEDALYSLIRKHQPDAIIVNNTGLQERGKRGHPQIDSVTFEQGRPTSMDRTNHSKYLAAEMCHTLNNHWGYGASDYNYKSLPQLIETLCACRKVGANYLLNIGPDGDGKIPLLQEALLCGIGSWIRETGNVIYTAKPCGIMDGGKNFALKEGNRLYFFIHDLPIQGNKNVIIGEGRMGNTYFSNVGYKLKNIRWTDRDEELKFVQNGNELEIVCTGYPYGKHLAVRVAVADIEE